MKVLFLNPPDLNKVSEQTIDEHSTEYIETPDYGSFAPLGLLYVMSYLEKKLLITNYSLKIALLKE